MNDGETRIPQVRYNRYKIELTTYSDEIIKFMIQSSALLIRLYSLNIDSKLKVSCNIIAKPHLSYDSQVWS